MTQDTIISIIQSGLLTIILVAGPPLAVGLIVGISVSIFQAVTSIQEPTLAFIPKIFGVLSAIIIFGSFMLTNLQTFIVNIYSAIPQYIVPR